MPNVIDYKTVLERLTAQGLRCNYFNGGSFGFVSEAHVRGWVGPADSTVNPAMRDAVRNVPEPYERNLAAAAARAWRQCLPGEVWVMPAAHWAYELGDASGDWLPMAIEALGLNVESLRGRTDAAAIEFSLIESAEFEAFVRRLLERLGQSDFTLAFPGRKTVCTVHHHKQLWWVSADVRVIGALDEMITELKY
jgi:hypothetical protein